jgi:dihydrofolate synthase/folylpolyglutamate synthase
MMEVFGHPERQFKSIHVTGTNGKGSTCAMVESVLRKAGYTTGLYTSPHLFTFHERIRTDGVNIPDEELIHLIREIRLVVEQEDIQPTFFEFTTALAFLYFARKLIDIAVIEVGMGGRYDATNVITPLVSVITNVGLDHTEYFGPTKQHVAKEKAGIIKPGVPVVIGEENPEILQIFESEAEEKGAPITLVQDAIRAEVLSSNLDGQEVRIQDRVIHLPLLGLHQVKNLATAIASLGAIEKDLPVSQDAIESGIADTKWEGRLEVVSKKPLILVDGAHNPDGARALGEFLKQFNRFDVVVFASKKGKDVSDILEYVISKFTHVIVAEGSYMPEDADVLAQLIQKIGNHVIIERNVQAACERAQLLVSDDGVMLITGSLYMVPDALSYLQRSV